MELKVIEIEKSIVNDEAYHIRVKFNNINYYAYMLPEKTEGKNANNITTDN